MRCTEKMLNFRYSSLLNVWSDLYSNKRMGFDEPESGRQIFFEWKKFPYKKKSCTHLWGFWQSSRQRVNEIFLILFIFNTLYSKYCIACCAIRYGTVAVHNIHCALFFFKKICTIYLDCFILYYFSFARTFSKIADSSKTKVKQLWRFSKAPQQMLRQNN